MHGVLNILSPTWQAITFTRIISRAFELKTKDGWSLDNGNKCAEGLKEGLYSLTRD